MIFLAYPYWAGLLAVQWSPLLSSPAPFFLRLLPATMAKPQIGLPVFFTRASRRGIVACFLLGALSLAVMPRWPLVVVRSNATLRTLRPPLLVLPGALLLLALLHYRDRDAILLLLAACMPQRWFFDSFILWLIPKSRREILATVFLSWGAGIWRWYQVPHSFAEVDKVGSYFSLFADACGGPVTTPSQSGTLD